MRIKISPIGNNQRHSTAQKGFTLIEMLVVLSIIGLLMVLAVPYYARFDGRLKLMTASQDLRTQLRHAQNEAITKKRTVVVVFHSQDDSYNVNGNEYKLPVQVVVTYDKDAGSHHIDNPTLHFYSDGSADPVIIKLSNQEHQAVLKTNWLTGRVFADAR